MTDRPDPYRSVSRELLAVLAEEGRPMSLRELERSGRLDAPEAVRQLSVARVAGFVRSMPGGSGGLEPAYEPTALGHMIARRSRGSRAYAAAQEERARQAARRLPPSAAA